YRTLYRLPTRWLLKPMSPRRYHPPPNCGGGGIWGISAASAAADGKMTSAAPTNAQSDVQRMTVPFLVATAQKLRAGYGTAFSCVNIKPSLTTLLNHVTLP